jgi:hypothetical protein
MPRLVERPGAYALLLQTAFNQICDEQDWKAPIDATVPWEAANVYMDAISHMTATTAKCEQVRIDGQVYARLTSIGYRMGPAGDH